MNPVLGLGIESSCDETSIAVVRDGKEILSNVVYSQIAEHAPFRGVVPEIASRSHLLKINDVLARALNEAGLSDTASLDYVAVTNRPGLVGSLMIGAQLARSIHLVSGTPIVTVDHVEAHFYAGFIERKETPDFPFLGLLLSGGNSALFRVDGLEQLVCIGDTRDDALGEAFDKAASLLELGYPGGPLVEKAAAGWQSPRGTPALFTPLLKDLTPEKISFSFSGIKTAVMLAARRGESIERIAHDFQTTAFELVTRMLLRGVQREGIRRIVASGGVLANGALRQTLDEMANREGLQLSYPRSRVLCTDNGAMVGALGFHLFRSGRIAPLDFPVSSVRL